MIIYLESPEAGKDARRLVCRSVVSFIYNDKLKLKFQVVENATEWRKGGRSARVPAAPPPRCRRELYDLMHECWRREPSQRPRFNDLHRFLERMTHGYKPPANTH